ncbi:gibberellin 3-beta-dioxygenase 1 [Senna tora]|uniref:gibberellin 3beta-dioxygenase n=1 Tax=Senna tora TaxID=362788 RepID=A0A834T8T6_9FABA|nr:gibberellin 3-beta-dioxygenase 1 [Senna tora]
MANISEEAANRIPLDFSSVKSLPDSHAWPHPGCSDGLSGSGSIPVVDLMDPNAMEAIGLACESWGAFQLNNHGIPLSLIEQVEVQATRLFTLPAHRKFKAQRSPGSITGYGPALISPFFPKSMWHEGFTIIGSPSDHAKRIWPYDHARFCEIMENYQKQMKKLAEEVTRMILKLVGVRDEEKEWVGSSESSGALQLNWYPPCPEPERAMGLAPHTDTSLLTILYQAQTSGLEILKQGEGWVPVRPHPGALVVHAGDLLHVMSNARFPSVLHRVTVNRTRQRYSFAYFYGPPQHCVISPPAFQNSVPRFRALTVKEYMDIKANNPDLALSSITIASTH